MALTAGALVVVGAWGLLRDHGASGPDGTTDSTTNATALAEGSPAPTVATLSGSEACLNVGYLCADLDRSGRVHVRRWKDFSGTLVVRVPRPDFEDVAVALELQRAAAVGLRAWNGQPFEIMTETRGDREAHIAVSWTRSLGGSQIGVTHTEWSPSTGLRVVSIELSTRSPFDATRLVDPRQVRLTAAHEMGHALGLPHSNAPRDAMYPTNTATSISAQDYRTMESLYRLPDGTEIVP